MDFGAAIRALKAGLKVARKGWNGKNMHLYLEEHFVFHPGKSDVSPRVFASRARAFDRLRQKVAAKNASINFVNNEK